VDLLAPLPGIVAEHDRFFEILDTYELGGCLEVPRQRELGGEVAAEGCVRLAFLCDRASLRLATRERAGDLAVDRTATAGVLEALHDVAVGRRVHRAVALRGRELRGA